MFDIVPKKCCLKYDPPSLVLFYEKPDENKMRRRSIPIKNIQKKDGDTIFLDLLDGHHGKYLLKFKRAQLIRVLNVLIEKNNGTRIKLDSDVVSGVKLTEDNLNKLDDDKLNEVKKHMNSSFESNQVKPGDVNWKYDLEVDFGNDELGKIESAGWDDEDDSDMEF